MSDEPTDDRATRERLDQLEMVVASLLALASDSSPSSVYRRYFGPLSPNRQGLLYNLHETKMMRDVFRPWWPPFGPPRLADETVSAFLSRIESLDGAVENLNIEGQIRDQKIDDLETLIIGVSAEQDVLQKDFHAYLIATSFGIDPNELPLHRPLPVRVYLSEAEPERVAQVSAAVADLGRSIGFDVADDFPEETGSWWKKLFWRSQEAITSPEMKALLDEVKHGIQVQGVEKAQAEADRNRAEAIARLTEAWKEIPNAAVQVGSLLVMKLTVPTMGPQIIARSLTPKEMIRLEKNPRLLQWPEKLLDQFCVDEEPPPPARSLPLLVSPPAAEESDGLPDEEDEEPGEGEEAPNTERGRG